MTSSAPRRDRRVPVRGHGASADATAGPGSALPVEERVSQVANIALHAWTLAQRSARAADDGGPGAAGSRERLERLLAAVAQAQQALWDAADQDGEAPRA